MLLIAHRGNTSGPSPWENEPDHVRKTLQQGYQVEVDVWYKHGLLLMGHDHGRYLTPPDLLDNTSIWWHCKNVEALEYLMIKGVICFFHHSDEAVLTSNGYLWTMPGGVLTKSSIAVMPETVDGWNVKYCAGICTDHIQRYSQ
jgi:hypothetical protein